MCQAIKELTIELEAISTRINEIKSKADDLQRIRSSLYNEVDDLRSQLATAMNNLSRLNQGIDAAKATVEKPLVDRIVAMLDGEFKLRTFTALVDATGATRDEIEHALDRADVDYVLRARTRDGAALIGLAKNN